MQVIFAPAIALLNRLAYTKKFTLLWVLSMVAIAVVVYSLFVSLERIIQPSQRQLEGLALIKPIAQTVQAIQLHRGIAARTATGKPWLPNLAAFANDGFAGTNSFARTISFVKINSHLYMES